MDVIIPRCAGLDVHKETVVVCRRVIGHDGKVKSFVRTFGTMTRDLLALSDWLSSEGVTHVAMESTGVYWKPIWNILEGQFELLLANAHDIRQVPGRKTDVKDCEWIAQLLQHGLLRKSFVPDATIRELRDLTRHRAQLVDDKTSVANRIHKILQDANIKLSSVATDVLGVSGRDMIRAILGGERDPEALAELARGRLRGKIPQLRPALEGRVSRHHRFMLEKLTKQLEQLESMIGEFDSRIEEEMRPLAKKVELLDSIPGIDRRLAENILAEIGPRMEQFPSAACLASWAGMSPGNNQSAGKRKSGKTAKANRHLRRALGEAAWAAARTKSTYAAAQYKRLVGRRGKKRAIVAVGHGLLVAAFHILKDSVPYRDLGPDHFNRLKPEQQKRYHVKRLQELGYTVTVQETPAA